VSIQIREANKDEVYIVYRTMREAFEEYNGKLNPPSEALRVTTQVIMENFSVGGSVIAWDNETAAGSARYKFIHRQSSCDSTISGKRYLQNNIKLYKITKVKVGR
jgi:hypothetical protein